MRRPTALLLALLLCISIGGCKSPHDGSNSSDESEKTRASANDSPPESDADTSEDSARYQKARRAMVNRQIEARGVEAESVLEAIRSVPRHRFVPRSFRPRAYDDTPLPIGHDQTISQPYIVAVMTETLQLEPQHKVLEIGTGSGYQASVLAELADRVYSIEIICELAKRAREALKRQGYKNVSVKCGDGYAGWPEHAPFDRIIVTAAPPEIPRALVEQLKVGGRMVLPVGENVQELKVVEKTKKGATKTTDMMKVRFVPMVRGESEEE